MQPEKFCKAPFKTAVIDTDGTLICAYDGDEFYNDNWVQVDDLTGLLDSEYKTLEYMLRLNYGYKMNGRFL